MNGETVGGTPAVRPGPALGGEAVRIEGLHKSYEKLEVLRGIDLTVAEHEVVCLIGASGSGKSTLLRCINLLEPIDSGRIVVGGQEITRVYEGEMNFALTVRLAEEYRRNVDAIRSIPVALPNSDPRAPTAYIALGELGDVRLETDRFQQVGDSRLQLGG